MTFYLSKLVSALSSKSLSMLSNGFHLESRYVSYELEVDEIIATANPTPTVLKKDGQSSKMRLM